jgi:hypothetical protein
MTRKQEIERREARRLVRTLKLATLNERNN